MNIIEVNVKLVSPNAIEYRCKISGEWERYFTGENFRVEYDVDISNTPKSVLMVPIFGTILQISWLFDGQIICDEIDEDFYNSIAEFKNGYIDMFPELELKGSIKIGKTVKNNSDKKKTAALFSGGADAFSTLISHIGEKPSLITIWGADVDYNNKPGWNKVDAHRNSVLKDWNLTGNVIRSNFRKFVNEQILHSYCLENAGDNWWHGFHHALGILCLLAPLSDAVGIKAVYIASSFSAKDKVKVKCASDPTTDNYVRFCGCRIYHDGYEFNRQDKIENICKYQSRTGQNILLRVCWRDPHGKNCCNCEKCFRTILGIYAQGANPENFGFSCDSASLKRMSKIIKKGVDNVFEHRNDLYEEMIAKFQENNSPANVPRELKWLYNNHFKFYRRKYNLRKTLSKIKRGAIKIIKGKNYS